MAASACDYKVNGTDGEVAQASPRERRTPGLGWKWAGVAREGLAEFTEADVYCMQKINNATSSSIEDTFDGVGFELLRNPAGCCKPAVAIRRDTERKATSTGHSKHWLRATMPRESTTDQIYSVLVPTSCPDNADWAEALESLQHDFLATIDAPGKVTIAGDQGI